VGLAVRLGLGLGLATKGLSGAVRAPFTSTWKTDNTGTSTDTQITLPLVSTGTYDFVANWGDGTSDTITAYDQAEVTHTYSTAGTYTVKIYGTIEGWQFDDGGDKLKLTNISQFGNLDITTDAAFYGCSNMTITATDAPDISSTSLLNMFRDCSSITTLPSLGNFDTSQVTNMYCMFYGCSSFNQSVSNFDTSQVMDMRYMFYGCDSMSSANLGTVKDWTITALTDAENFMAGCTNSMSTADYDALLIAWEGQTHYTGAANTMPIHFNNATYTAGGAAEAARTALVNDGWDITDGGVAE
jgi:surface protein